MERLHVAKSYDPLALDFFSMSQYSHKVGFFHVPLTSVYFPPLPNSSFRSAARLSPLFSSSILDIQSSLPVHTTTCSAYPAMTPFSGFSRSISSPSGMAGVSAQLHVGDGQVETVGNGGGGCGREDFEVRPLRLDGIAGAMLCRTPILALVLNWRDSLSVVVGLNGI